jgi:transposase InsO family protein
MGIVISQPTIQKILRQNGFSPRPGEKVAFSRVTSSMKDAAWALDFFAVKTAKGAWLQALVVIDMHTRELLELRVHDGWDVDSRWTARIFAGILRRTSRKPIAVVHDHGTHFQGMFTRALQVLEIDDVLTPRQQPWMNCFAERAIWSIRHELLRHVPVADAEQLQLYLDEYQRFANAERSHQGLAGQTPEEAAPDSCPVPGLETGLGRHGFASAA